MKHMQAVCCPHCHHEDLIKNGKDRNGTQRWYCKGCGKSFRLQYRYTACQPGIQERIIDLTLNGSGVRDIERVLMIHRDTVTATLKKTTNINPYFITREENAQHCQLEVEIRCACEMDEFWSFVKNKANQRWTWYAIEKVSGCILAWHNGKRKEEDFLKLWEALQGFDISRYDTDDWGAYSKYIPPQLHRIGKEDTWKIERKNLNFRTHLKRLHRKTICFSKDETIHDNVIGLYIERYYYKTGTFSAN